MTRLRWSALAALALALAGCGEGDAADGPADGPTEVDVEADLEITAGVVDEPASRGVARLTCGSGGPTGTGWLEGPAAAEACERLADPAVRARLGPPPADQVCTEVYGGPDVARVVGTVDGEPVDAELDRSDGCGISRWQALSPLVPEPVGDGEARN